MTTTSPEVDGRSDEELLEELFERAPFYVPEWDPDADDDGAALLRLFAELAGDVVERLDQVPEKHRIAFFDTLGFAREPPQPARVPLTVTVADGVGRNVPVPPGTEAVADDLTFEVGPDDGFEATPAVLDRIYSVDPGMDGLFDHSADTDGGFVAFDGRNRQEHALYVGHADLFTLVPGTSIEVAVETTVGEFSGLRWEYFGEEAGVEGWHRLEPRQTERASERAEYTFDLSGTPTETAVGGTTSRWLRCRPSEGMSAPFDVVLDTLSVGVTPDSRQPDAMFRNDVPLPVDEGVVTPFGELPRARDAFYLRSDEAFSKKGTTVELQFFPPEAATTGLAPTPTVSWEYWNGDGWARLDADDGTADLTEDGTVSFVVPSDLTPTAVAGEEGHWVRARLVDGDYGQPRYVEVDGEWIQTTGDVAPPKFSEIEVRYTVGGVEPDHLLAANNGEVCELALPGETPFVALPDETQTLYLGFDRALEDGPIQLFFPIGDHEYPEAFTPRVRWEYCTDGEWERLGVTDSTADLTRRGIVGLVFPEATVASTRFGETRHWVRARVTRDEFDRPQAEPNRSDDTEIHEGIAPCEEPLETAPPAHAVAATPPELGGIHPNTGWIHNVQTIEGEVLGSSDGDPDQTFTISTPPVVTATVWVDELDALSATEREKLATGERETETETGPGGSTRAFWVAWERVGDLLDASAEARHYTLDGATGRLAFGDGVNGRIPPRGRDNVRVDYRTGGGVAGNVSPDTVSDLKSSIPYVDAVTNPEAGDGGAPEETMDEVLERAPRQLRDRNRAVTAADYERIALTSVRALARARCLPGLDAAGDRTPGWVTLLVVPETSSPNPVPSVELRQQVEAVVAAHAPVSVVEPDRLIVRGPTAVIVSVDTTLSVTPAVNVSAVEADAANALNDFLHPLTGGDDGDGWAFGALPHLSDCYALLEGVAGVDHVADLALTFEGSGEPVRVTEGDPTPAVAPDVLVRPGTHEIRGTR